MADSIAQLHRDLGQVLDAKKENSEMAEFFKVMVDQQSQANKHLENIKNSLHKISSDLTPYKSKGHQHLGVHDKASKHKASKPSSPSSKEEI